MENGYTFDELKRERLSGIINGLILELAWQDKIVFYKLPDRKIPLVHHGSADVLINRLAELDDEDYKKFIDKLTDTIIDM